MRVVGCVEIANDRQLLDKLLILYQKFESSSTSTTLLFPWLPGQSKIRRTLVGAQMYYIFKKIVDERKRTGRTEEVSENFPSSQIVVLTFSFSLGSPSNFN